MARSVEAVVVGGGPGGYVAAIRLGQLGVDTVLVEREAVGGVCLNWGCVPSKALIHVAGVVHEARRLERIGVRFGAPEIDLDAIRAWKDGVVSKLTGGVGQLVKGSGVEILSGEARLAGPGRLVVRGEGGEETLTFEHCVLATGARPIEVPGLEVDGDLVWGARQAVDLPRLPEHLLVVGGGVIGIELGTVYAKLGAKVTVVEMLDEILPGVDADLVRVVRRSLKKLGVDVRTGTRARGLERGEGPSARMTLEGKKGSETLEVDAVLVSVGFSPRTEGLGLETVGLAPGAKGALEVDDRMATGAPGIYAIGDLTGAPYLAHRAFQQGEVAAEVIAGRAAAYDVRALPMVIFSDPEVATTGLSEAAAKAAGYSVKVGRFHFAANGRALGSDAGEGFVKVVVDAEHEVLLGAQIVGPGASELVAEATLGVEMGAVVDDVGLTVHAHPTLAEAMQEATLAALGRAVHILKR